ncbi:helix-turn-helix domain-containing protein [Streptococcus sp.]|nr:helix-turn-helix domain-containing protein [Streptococcus sp.]MDY3824744.1 helix-turn-helix transcriptional regulator [Streptococcus sp.]
MIQIDENIRKYRRKKGLSQQDLADIIGVSHQAISKWERGENYPDLLSLVSLSQFFEVDINHLVYKE